MANEDVFEMETGPYIPRTHKQYNLLPCKRENGGEVFSYPAELKTVEDLLWEAEGLPDDGRGRRKSLLMPYGYASYKQYLDVLRGFASKYCETNPELADVLKWLIGAIRRMNVKENWSVVRYIGHEYDGEHPGSGLTRGRCYYWPCSEEKPVYEGVIDDDEFTSYLYPCDPESWEIVQDPTGMAARALAGDADTLHSWYPEMALEEGTIDAFAAEIGAVAKRTQPTATFEEGVDDSWSESEADPVNFKCPGCGETIHYSAWTLVNAQRNPELAARLMEGTLFEFTCPSCGYTASLVQPCLFLDPMRRACVYLVVDEQMAQGVAEMFDGTFAGDGPTGEPDAVKRIVFDRHDLRGRAIALAHGLDDRAIELLKIALVGMAKQQGVIPSDDDSSVVRLVGVEGKDLVFDLEHGGGIMTAAMPRGGYDHYADAIARSSLTEEQPYFVGRTWARNAIEVLNDEGML